MERKTFGSPYTGKKFSSFSQVYKRLFHENEPAKIFHVTITSVFRFYFS